MTSQIIPTNPTAGSASTSSVRENFRIADEEITKLQRTNIDAQDLTGGPVLYSVNYPQPEANLQYVDGMRIAARVNVTNADGSLTVLSLRVNGGDDVRLKSVDGLDLDAGDLVVGQYYEFILNAPGGGATPYFACVNINKLVTLSSLDVQGEITADLITLHPTGGAGEGGQVQFQRELDSTVDWYIDAYGESTTTDLRFVNTGTGSDIIPFQVEKNGIYVQGEALGNTVGDETIQAEFRSANANASYLKVQDERWENGTEWTSASKLLQFGVDSSDHAYIASSTEGSGLRGIEIGTHDGAGAREKFFVGDADGGAYLFYDNVKKLQTTSDGVLITGGDIQTGSQPSLVLRSTENASGDNNLGEIVFQGENLDGDNHTYAFMRAEAVVAVDNNEKGKIEYFIRKAGNVYQNALNITSVGIDVPGSVDAVSIAADYINLNGNNPLDPEAVSTGDVLCKRIRLDDPTTNYNDLFQIYAEADGDIGSMVLESKDNPNDKIIFRMGNYNETGDPQYIDVLTATATDIRIPQTKALRFGAESDGQLKIFEGSNGNGYIHQDGIGDLVIQGQNGYLKSDSKDVASWGELDIALKYNGANRIKTESFGTTTVGVSTAKRFEVDVNQITDDTTWSSFSRDGGSNALYVQQGDTSTNIASFRKGGLGAGTGTEVLGVRPGGIVVGGTIQGEHVANDGTAGFTGTASNPTSFTIKNGLITAIS